MSTLELSASESGEGVTAPWKAVSDPSWCAEMESIRIRNTAFGGVWERSVQTVMLSLRFRPRKNVSDQKNHVNPFFGAGPRSLPVAWGQQQHLGRDWVMSQTSLVAFSSASWHQVGLSS